MQQIKRTLGVTDSQMKYIDQYLNSLAPFKFTDPFQIIHKILENYRDFKHVEVNMHNKDEKAFLKSMLGLVWTWIRLVILRANAFNMESYLYEMG